MHHNLLIVDDEPNVLNVLVDFFSNEPYGVFSAATAEDALDILERENIDVVITDELMPGMSGSEFISIVRKKFPDTVRIILTGHASLEKAIRAINEGEIYRFFTKPCNLVDLALTVRQALKHQELLKENKRLIQKTSRQGEIIEELEKMYPGITKVNRTREGEIILDETFDERAGLGHA